jgi:peptidyl-prolyl cis-trans isomerase C
LSRHLRLSRYWLLILVFSIAGCSQKEEKKEYIAKVNDSYLTEEDLTAISGGYSGQTSFKEEMIRKWIDRELLYQEAKKRGIPEEENYKDLIRNSEKELAAALMLEKIFTERLPPYKNEDLKLFYEQNGDLFRINQYAYLVSIAEFSDENKAVMFRSAAVESEWNKALNFFKSDQTLQKEEHNRILYSYELQPLKLSRIMDELNPGEVSLVLNNGSGNYMVARLISRLEPGTIPPFDVIKENIENRFIASKRAEILRSYYEDLYSANDIDVKK